VSRRLAAVFAHPDDDTYGVAGSVALHASDGIEVTVILATSGEAGRILDPSLASRENLGVVRETEDRASWAEIGVKPSFHFLRHPDGGLAAVPAAALASQIEGLLEQAQPEVVVTFGPDGVTGHEDHIAVGEAATGAFHHLRERAGDAAPYRLLHVGILQSRLDRLNMLLRERGMEPLDPSKPFMPRGIPDRAAAVVVDCMPAYERKIESLRRHKTQGELEDLPFELWPDVVGVESFVQVWPERAPDDLVLGDVFEGIALA
jgi:LmbE family N-acetylglucosaminyl deacetylase